MTTPESKAAPNRSETLMTKLEQDLMQALESLIDAVAGEQRDPEELARALGKDAPRAIEYAESVIKAAPGRIHDQI